MTAVVPYPFLFHFEFRVHRNDRLPRRRGKRLLNLSEDYRLPEPRELENADRFADLRVAWNARGLGVSVVVHGKTSPPTGRIDAPDESDGLQIWVDTRNTQNIHRASRYCHHFCLLPESGDDGSGTVAVQKPIARARENSPLADPDDIAIAAGRTRDGYRLEAWLAGDALTGFDPEATPRLGFYYWLRDAELGDQFLTVGHEFPFPHDPSLWSTLELVD